MTNSIKQQSNYFFQALQSRFSKVEFSLWLADLQRYSERLEIVEGTLCLAVVSETRLKRINSHYSETIAELAAEHFSGVSKVVFRLLGKEEIEHAKTKNVTPLELATIGKFNGNFSSELLKGVEVSSQGELPASNDVANQLVVPSKIHTKTDFFRRSWTSPHHSLPFASHSFQTFVECPENELALKFAKRVTTQFSKNSPLYFFGSVGVGKTHLLYSVMQAVQTLFPFYKARYMTPHHFVAEFTAALKAKKDREFRTYYHSLDLLIIDDVQFFMGKEKTAIEFFHLFNSIYAPGKQMLIASDRRPSELGGLENRLKSRLASSVVIEMLAPEQESREKILRFYLKEANINFSDDIIHYIANNMEGDVRKITGMVRTLAAIGDVRGKNSINLETCKSLLSTFSVHQKQVVNPENVIKSVMKYYSLTSISFTGSRRGKFVSRARQVAAYLLKKHTSLTMKEIGHALGGRVASTVVHGIGVVEALRHTSEMRMAVAEIERGFTELD